MSAIETGRSERLPADCSFAIARVSDASLVVANGQEGAQALADKPTGAVGGRRNSARW